MSYYSAMMFASLALSISFVAGPIVLFAEVIAACAELLEVVAALTAA
jgi:hypothetical protein